MRVADVVVGAIEVPLSEASNFGVMTTDGNGRISRFDEKPADPAEGVRIIGPDEAAEALAQCAERGVAGVASQWHLRPPFPPPRGRDGVLTVGEL